MTNEKYKEFQLSEWIIPHIIKDLYVKGDLAQKVFEYKDLKKSVRTTFIPEDWNIKKVEENYLNLDTSRSITRNWLAGKVKEFVLTKDDHIAIFENPLARPSDPWIKTENVPIIVFKDDVLIDIYGKDAESIDYIEQRIRYADACLFGIMTSLPKSSLPLTKTINENTIDLLAKRCESMIVTAFDGTGCIICSFNK